MALGKQEDKCMNENQYSVLQKHGILQTWHFCCTKTLSSSSGTESKTNKMEEANAEVALEA